MAKNIIICCDGTGNEYCREKTNVAKLFDIVERNPENGQIAYYDPGVGTIGWAYSITWFGKMLTRLMGLAFAIGLTQNIEDAYRFLMNHFEDGDRIFLFGFSRGAYTARALGGMIIKSGLLYPERENMIPHATKLYRNRKIRSTSKDAIQFRRAFCHKDCAPYFIGVWDTVKSVGVFNRIRFGDNVLSPHILFGCHAVSIDEKRIKFRPVLWRRPKSDEQVIEQVWFPGVHCDIGGSYEDARLADIAFRWMLDGANKRGLILAHEDEVAITPDCKGKKHESFKGWWRLLPFKTRRIEKEYDIHPCAIKKLKKDSAYNSKNLRKYIAACNIDINDPQYDGDIGC